jgi:drug/metabolite transporter (DMT)-like permease
MGSSSTSAEVLADVAPGAARRPSDLQLTAMLSVVILTWSANFVIAKVALAELPPLLVVGLRTLLTGLFILPVYWWEQRSAEPRRWTAREAAKLFALGFVGVTINQGFFVIGIGLTTVAHAAIVVGLTPMVTLLVAILAGQERMNWRRLGGMILALAGLASIQLLHRDAGPKPPSLVGDLFIFLSSLAFALFGVFGKKVSGRYSSVTVNTFAYLGGGLALLPLTLWWALPVDFARVPAGAWASLLYMALGPSLLGYLMFYAVLKHMAASRVLMFTYVNPVLAILLGIVFLAERPGPALYLGGALVLAGVFVSEPRRS